MVRWYRGNEESNPAGQQDEGLLGPSQEVRAGKGMAHHSFQGKEAKDLDVAVVET